MTGAPLAAVSEIDTAREAVLSSQARGSAMSSPSTSAKSAVSADSLICTRTVAADGLSVNATERSACQGSSASSTEVLAIERHGCGPGDMPPCANNATVRTGTTDARIL